MDVEFLLNGLNRNRKVSKQVYVGQDHFGKKSPSIHYTSMSATSSHTHTPEFNTLERLPVLPFTNSILPIFRY
jgi:hypothetical protein